MMLVGVQDASVVQLNVAHPHEVFAQLIRIEERSEGPHAGSSHCRM